MLEITGSDIASLNEEDLRSLVGKLCETELRSRDLSASAVTWGGNQNAADGGIDVRVRITDGAAPGGFMPRPSIGFQVKKTDHTPRLITREMRPSGHLRASISGLIDERGAYIIASAGSDASDTALSDRLTAMRSAVADKSKHADLHLDFYDRNRLATWTGAHAGLVLWVRQKIGRGISGWQPYTSWAVSPDGVDDEYLFDDQTRLHGGVTDAESSDVTSGINRIRNVLRSARGVVRLVGLSGVGKTRLVQALFDPRIGAKSLNTASVIYADMNDNPSPQPTGMISDLIASRTRAIVVIDNCAPDLHRRVAELSQASQSLISVVTVEYDVQDDEPEGTEVFRLEPSSVELVSNLIARRFPEMTRLDVDKIAEFSGGNARVALALANTLERRESVAGLLDEELFRRLFYQRQEHDDSLLKAATACALLYSFQGEALSGDDAELPKIAALVGMNAQQLFAKVAQLKQRDLVQRRNLWRAILPQAIANRLAKLALREIPLEVIEQHFNTDRLLKSFSRRLGYLHESDEAKTVAEKWLAKNGLLAEIGRLNELGLAMFNNIAPVAPGTALAAIESELSGPNAAGLTRDRWRRDRIGTILHSIAYDASLFERCIAAMIPLAIAEQLDGQTGPVEGALESLFQLFLSGTHATIEQRAGVTVQLLRSNESRERSLGLKLLEALLQADNFSGTHSFEFGARVRDYGHWPATREERAHWFITTLQQARQVASQNDEIAPQIRSKVARALRSVWFLSPEVQDQFEAIAKEICATGYWQEGWIAVRSVLSRPGERDADPEHRLRAFEHRLRPRNILEQVRTVVLTQDWGPLDYANMDTGGELEPESPMAAYDKANAVAEGLGQKVCDDERLFAALLPDLVTGKARRLIPFGRGLALASDNPRLMWEQLTQALAKTEEGERNVGALIGFIGGLSTVNHELCEELLEEALGHRTLGVWFPVLQTSVSISKAGSDRLNRAAALKTAPVDAFRSLGWERPSDALSGDDVRNIVLSLAKQENGYSAATDILAMRVRSDGELHPPELVDAGRRLLSEAVFADRDNMHDYRLSTIAKVCLRGKEGSAAARHLCEAIRRGLKDRTFRRYSYEQLLQCIFQLQPETALDIFFGTPRKANCCDFGVDDFDGFSDRRDNPLAKIPMADVLRWCDEKPVERYPAISRVVSFYSAPEHGGSEWTPLAMEMLKRAPDPLTVLETFVGRFSPRSWSGSRAAIIESRLGLLNHLGELKSPSLADYVKRIRPELVDEIARTRKWENELDRERHERFE